MQPKIRAEGTLGTKLSMTIVGVDANSLGPRIDETTQTLSIKRRYKHALGQGR